MGIQTPEQGSSKGCRHPGKCSCLSYFSVAMKEFCVSWLDSSTWAPLQVVPGFVTFLSSCPTEGLTRRTNKP